VNAKSTIKKVLFIALWLCIGAGMFTLLLAAISNKNKGECREYTIKLKAADKNYFIDEKDVEVLLMKATNGKITGQPVSSFNLFELETMLEDNTWINKAELYFDSRDVLHVTVTEKEPVARIFTTAGNSFYIDSAGRKIPLSQKMSARVPVFTGYPDKKKWNAIDSMLLNSVRVTANYIMQNTFWLAQVAQIDITPERTFEMVPVVGNHLVKIGAGEDIDRKFNNLRIFYSQVLSKTGFDKYKIIDVRFKGQIVASKQTGDSKVDSVQLRKNVDKLLRQSVEADKDTVFRVAPSPVKLEKDPVDEPVIELNAKEEKNQGITNNPNTANSSLSSQTPAMGKVSETVQKENFDVKKNPAEGKRVPKAVMPKREVTEQNKNNN